MCDQQTDQEHITHTDSHTHTRLSQTGESVCSGGDAFERPLTSTVSEAVQDVALVAKTLKAARVVDADVVTCSLKGAFIDV